MVPGSDGVRTNLSVDMNRHHRLGSPGSDVMSDLSRRGDIPRISQEEVSEVKSCELFCEGKMQHNSRAPESEDVAIMPKMDLIGPLLVKSMNVVIEVKVSKVEGTVGA